MKSRLEALRVQDLFYSRGQGTEDRGQGRMTRDQGLRILICLDVDGYGYKSLSENYLSLSLGFSDSL